MNTFLVICDDPMDCGEVRRIAEQMISADVYGVSDTILLIRYVADNPKVLSDVFGMTGESDDPRVGAVFKLNGSRSGYYYADLWNWLSKVEGAVSD